MLCCFSSICFATEDNEEKEKRLKIKRERERQEGIIIDAVIDLESAYVTGN